ncbi:phosphoglycolate phosphatase (plasmid) [Maritalea myrionectae]|uniref:phosphoglycolate phosphatase n=1 Tax=Maritalea myrionectae TaxID=454601 RepID=A0A2R4MJN6_9HYPH|nr:HAD-IA family hydrolase [Maritalea myrionectae]AVX06185.1 phosphoglycolate phosphatase [Maritalea myrionectae]
MPHKYKAIIFDLDGTLVDSLGDFHHAARVMLNSIGHAPIPAEVVKTFIGNGQEMFIARCLVHVGANLTAQQLIDATKVFEQAYDEADGQYSRLFDGVEALIQFFKADGAKVGLCTNRPVARAHKILASYGIAEYFDEIAGFETTEKPKPAPDPILHCLKQFQCAPSQALFVGDSDVDAEAADKAGVEFAFHTQGFGSLKSQPCQILIDHYTKIDFLPTKEEAQP